MGRLYEKRKQREGRPSVTYEEGSNTQLRQNDVVPLDKIDRGVSKLVLPFIHG